MYNEAIGNLSISPSGRTHTASLVALLLTLEFKQFFNNIVRVNLQLVIEVILDFWLELLVSCRNAEVALSKGKGT